MNKDIKDLFKKFYCFGGTNSYVEIDLSDLQEYEEYKLLYQWFKDKGATEDRILVNI